MISLSSHSMNAPTFPGVICISLEYLICCEVLICDTHENTAYIFIGAGEIKVIAGSSKFFGYTLRRHVYIIEPEA
jgi:hypothetical protein